MSDAVLITLIICSTLLAIVVLAVISGKKDKDPDNKHGSGSHGLD